MRTLRQAGTVATLAVLCWSGVAAAAETLMSTGSAAPCPPSRRPPRPTASRPAPFAALPFRAGSVVPRAILWSENW